MRKTRVLVLIIKIVFPVIFNVFFFMLGGAEQNASVWISWGYIHFAYCALIFTPLLVSAGHNATVLGLSLYSVSSGYFIIECALGAIFMGLASENPQAAFLVQLCAAGVYAAVMASCLLMNERSVHALRTRRHNLEYIKTALLKMAPLLGSVEDRAAKKKMEKLYDEIQSSPVQSSAVLEQTETNILLSIGMLGNAVSTGDTERILSLTDSLLLAVSERNNTLKMLN